MVCLWPIPGNPSKGNEDKHKMLYEKGYNPQVVGDGPGIMRTWQMLVMHLWVQNK